MDVGRLLLIWKMKKHLNLAKSINNFFLLSKPKVVHFHLYFPYKKDLVELDRNVKNLTIST